LLEKGTDVAPEVRANALSSASVLLACYLGNYTDAEHMSREALGLARKSGDKLSIADALYALGAAMMESHIAQARPYFDEALVLFQGLDDSWGIAKTLNVIGEVTRLEGDDESAQQLYQQAMGHFPPDR
jgi:tetratricopeptide (TPR) repeat protein